MQVHPLIGELTDVLAARASYSEVAVIGRFDQLMYLLHLLRGPLVV